MQRNKDDRAGRPVVDEHGEPVLDERGEPLFWATRGQRLLALLGALAVIAVTVAFAYALSTGDLFFH